MGRPASDCLSESTIFQFAQGQLDEAEVRRIDEHLAGCADCREVAAETIRFFHEADEPAAEPRLARYQIVEPIAAGAAGVVYRAFDPQLRRKVAIKVVRSGAGASATDEGTARLLREAETMAQLAHPNVVAVHDAGIYRGQIYIVMELVEGSTLAEWLRSGARTWREIAAMFAAAGRGLAAAHAIGLVHRDFKPDNVLLGADGRPRVTDFGLAQPLGAEAATAGTPSYMAPEQFAGRPADPRTDQFAFCVALYTALYGQHPFAVETAAIEEIARAAAAGRVRLAPPGAEVPAWLRALLLRGLQPDPTLRHARLDDLLDEMARGGPPQRGRWRVFAALGAVATLAVATTAWWVGRAHRRPALVAAPCQAGDARFTWSENGHCYARHERPLPWAEAQAACRVTGAHLAAYGSAAEMTAVTERLLRATSASYWIGFSDRRARGEYAWVTQEPFTNLRGWAALHAPAGNCVAASASARWLPAPCSIAFGFVCEDPGWTVRPHDGHAYKAFHDEMRWEAARRSCADQGAHLVVLDDAEENAFVAAHVIGTHWVGGIRQRPDDGFWWLDGRAVAPELFAAGDPDLKETPACLVVGDDHRLHDRPCDGSQDGPYGFVCERE